MTETLHPPQLSRMLLGAVQQIRENHEWLSRLDSAVGDGDHGTTILRAMEAVAKAVSETNASDLQGLLTKAAWNVMGCDGGSTGPLLGSFLLGMSEAAAGKSELHYGDFVTLFDNGIARMARQSRAKVGDKTMMDAFLPALDALKAAGPAHGIKAALQQAAAAASSGADATKNMRARFGRARNLGDRVIGHPDPGAVSVSLIFKGFSEAL